jgi:hydrogenase expression/formation protein HypC
MCIAIPGQIIHIDNGCAVVDIMGIQTNVNIRLIEKVAIKDYVLIHAGFAIQKIDKYYYTYLNKIYEELFIEDDIFNG